MGAGEQQEDHPLAAISSRKLQPELAAGSGKINKIGPMFSCCDTRHFQQAHLPRKNLAQVRAPEPGVQDGNLRISKYFVQGCALPFSIDLPCVLRAEIEY